MDGSQAAGAAGANSSSDFVRRPAPTHPANMPWLIRSRSESCTSMTRIGGEDTCQRNAEHVHRMLEDPSYSQVVRWGDEGDSFVVLEVIWFLCPYNKLREFIVTVEREVHQVHPAKTLQTQQLRKLCPPAEQVRFPQSAPQQ